MMNKTDELDGIIELDCDEMIIEIAKELKYMELPPHFEGYHYIEEALRMVMIDGILEEEDILTILESKYKMNKKRINALMKDCIGAWLSTIHIDIISEYFPRYKQYKRLISNMEFICRIADEMQIKNMIKLNEEGSEE